MNVDARLLTVNEIAALLNCSTRTVYRAIRQGDLPHVRVGRVIRISHDDMERWLAESEEDE